MPEGNASLQVLRQESKGPVTVERLSTMSGWRYDQILTSEAFGVPDRNDETEKVLEKIKKLCMKDRLNAKQQSQLEELMEMLEKISPLGAEAQRRKMVQEEIQDIRKDLGL